MSAIQAGRVESIGKIYVRKNETLRLSRLATCPVPLSQQYTMPSQLKLIAITIAFALCWNFATGDEPDARQHELTVGKPAPPLKADRWFKRQPLSVYDAKKFYVVEVWATWCGPCILQMPHLSELAKKYAQDGLEVIALTATDRANTVEAVEKFVKGRGKDFLFGYATCGEATYESFMAASGNDAIPCSFVIDRQGKIAYVGRPENLDYVLSRVAAGKWRGKADADELQNIADSIKALPVLAQKDPEAAMKFISKLEKMNLERTYSLDVASVRVSTLAQLGKYAEAKAAIEAVKPHYLKSKDWGGLAMVAAGLASRTSNTEGVQRAYALGVMKESRTAAKEDVESLVKIAIAYRISNDLDLFVECMTVAIEKTDNPGFKAMLQQSVDAMKMQGGEQPEK